ncbi:hypothetical protein [Paenibacillus lutrae]|uniref:Uncharacterized protein n=1 Tax=Paenibacillus lutrae TaxID=2078573 RepID=A0A7X3FLN0_9BACL|nr:hypothetical protein [Paenibacillus lutrae]MVP01917.1 hypothetical protein [Paenibacillus lutrae]
MNRAFKITILASVTIAAMSVASVTTNSFALNTTVTTPRKITEEELSYWKQNTGAIYTEFSKFVKDSSPKDLPDSETSRSVDLIKADTKQIIDPEYGIYIKE